MAAHEAIRRGRWALAIGLVVACSHGPGRRESHKRFPERLPPETVRQAKAEFAEVSADYERAAESRLSASQCADFSQRFTRLYKRYGRIMTLAWFNAGAVLDQCGKTLEAEKIYQAIVAAEPTFDLAYNNLGVIHWNRREEAQAQRYFKLAVDANPRTRAPRNNLAAALRNKYAGSPASAQFDAAETHLQNVLAVDSSNRIAFENLARLYYDRGRLQDKSYLLLAELVVTQANRVLESEGEQSADLHNLHGLLLMERDNQVDALRAFKRAVEFEPRHADAHMNIAMIALRFRDYEQAERSIGTALEDRRQRGNVEAYLGLGVARRGLRKYADAKQAFERAMKVDAADARALYNLGVLHQEHIAPAQIGKDRGQRGNRLARSYFEAFVARAQRDAGLQPTVADARARLKSIEEYLEAIRVGDELEKQAAATAREQEKQESERRERLLQMERKALEAQTGQH